MYTEPWVTGRSKSCKMLPRWIGHCQRKGMSEVIVVLSLKFLVVW